MPDIDLAVILADGEYLKRDGDTLVGEIPAGGGGPVTDLPAMVAPDNVDVFEVVDVSDTTAAPGGTPKKLQLAELWTWLEIPAGITTEDAVDATAAAFAAGTHSNVTVTYNDASNSISLAATGASLAQTVETAAGTTYTVVAADSNKIKSLTGTATITLPSAGLAAGERVDFVCVGGAATFTLGGGATWHVAPTPSAVARAIGSWVTAVKMGATTWALVGDLA